MSAIIGRYSNAVSQHKESNLSRPLVRDKRQTNQMNLRPGRNGVFDDLSQFVLVCNRVDTQQRM